jgi:ABC-type transporter Mla MlaB component
VAATDDDPFSLDFTSAVTTPPAPEPKAAVVPETAVAEQVSEPAPPAVVPEPAAPAAAQAPSYPPVTLPPALLEAAELYAQGQDIEACRRLEGAIKGSPTPGDDALRIWQALFELLQALGRQQAFDTLAMAYARRFELSPPTWMAPAEDGDQVNASSGGRAHVTLTGTLNARVGDALKQMMKLAQSSSLVRLDLAKLTDADNDGATLLMRALAALKKARKEYLFGSPGQLADILAAKLEPGRREYEAMWLLLLELYQQAYRQVEFEEAAVNYAITFEVSPPSFVPPPARQAHVPAAPAPEAPPLSLHGQLLGAGAAEFAEIAACSSAEVEINALGLVRIDAASVEALKPVLVSLNTAGRHVRISGLSQLVAAYLAAREVAAQAELRTRKV